MSLVRVAASLPLRTCLQAANTSCQRKIKRQSDFEGVSGAFCWNHNTGFGRTHNDDLVLVSKGHRRNTQAVDSIPECQVWQDIIEPVSLLSHENLRDELQMNVLAYDDNAVQCWTDLTVISEAHVPIYRGSVSNLYQNGTGPFSGPYSSTGGQNNAEGGEAGQRRKVV